MIPRDSNISVARIKSNPARIATKELSWTEKPQVHYWMAAIPIMMFYMTATIFEYTYIAFPALIIALLALGFFYLNPKLKSLMPKKLYRKSDTFFKHWINPSVKNFTVKKFYTHLQKRNVLTGVIGKDILLVNDLMEEYSINISRYHKRKLNLILISSGILVPIVAVAFARLIANESDAIRITIIGVFILLLILIGLFVIDLIRFFRESFLEGNNLNRTKRNLKLLSDLHDFLLRKK